MKFDEANKPKIFYQGVDTLRTAHIIQNEEAYNHYLKLLNSLDNFKDEAIQANKNFEFENGIAFDFYTFGKFFILPKGQSRFKYVIMNNDITISFSTVKFGAGDYSIPQILVEYRAKYLSLLGHKEAYNTVLSMFSKLFACDSQTLFRTQLMRIDLCTDLGYINYVPIDKYRFQTTFKSQSHLQFIEHTRYNRLTGFSFGKGDYMFRIYDKRLELNNNSSKLWLTRLWVSNGYPDTVDDKPPVWRHEVQFRRPYLKKFRPHNCMDEVSFFFGILDKLWSYGFNKINYVDISDKNILKIMNMDLSSEALKKVFQRTKKNNPSLVWDLVGTWHGFKAISPTLTRDIKSSDYKVAKGFLKAYISSCYKASGGDPYSSAYVYDLVQQDMFNRNGTNLDDYGANKVFSSFLDNSSYIQDYGFCIDYNNRHLALKAYRKLQERFKNLNDSFFDNNEYRLATLFNTTIQDLRENLQYYIDLDYEYEQDKITPLIEVEYCEF